MLYGDIASEALEARRLVELRDRWPAEISNEDALRELLALNGGGPVREGVVLCGS